ncbi:MAG TPA: carbon storage regulator [Pirellulaceae bacterium]|nr:carbon storage regulator [Pirellulaceae bacterium]
MLVLSRKIGEKLVIDGGIVVTVNRIAGNRVTLGIEAPDHVRIVRGELKPVVEAFGSGVDTPVPVLTGFGGEGDVASASVPRLAK